MPSDANAMIASMASLLSSEATMTIAGIAADTSSAYGGTCAFSLKRPSQREPGSALSRPIE